MDIEKVSFMQFFLIYKFDKNGENFAVQPYILIPLFID